MTWFKVSFKTNEKKKTYRFKAGVGFNPTTQPFGDFKVMMKLCLLKPRMVTKTMARQV